MRLIFGVALITCGFLVISYLAYPYASYYFTETVSNIEASQAGFHLVIPSVKINAPVYEGINQEILIKGLGHNKESRYPGDKGTCIIEGHNLNAFWPGAFENVRHPERYFARLNLVKPGAHVLVSYKGKKYEYTVQRVEHLRADDPTLRSLNNYEELVLVTCSPGIMTLDRLKVTCIP